MIYTVGVRNRFNGLDLIDRVPDELWNEVHDIVQETGIKTIPIENKCKKSKMAVWGGLKKSCEKKRSKKQRRKGKIYPFKCRVPKKATIMTSSNNTREDSTHGHHQMVNTEIRLIIFFAVKDGEAPYSQQKQDREWTVAQIMNSLLPNSHLN